MINASEMKRGSVVRFDGELFTIVSYGWVKPGKGPAYLQTKIKHLKNGNVMERRLQGSDKVDSVFVERLKMEYLYEDGSSLVFMDTTTFEQTFVQKDILGDGINYLQPNIEVQISVIEGEVVSVELPPTVTLKIVETSPPLKGATVTNKTKPAILETGCRVMVPDFVEDGTAIRVDTRSGEYIERAK